MKPSFRHASIWSLALVATLASQGSIAEPKKESKRDSVEVRLMAIEGGVPFKSASSQSPMISLEALPLLRARDFVRAEAHATKAAPTRTEGTRSAKNSTASAGFELEIILSERGKTRFNAAVALDRERKFCIISAGSIRACSGLASSQKSPGEIVLGMDRAEAQRLVASLGSAIRSNEAAVKTTEGEKLVATARDLLDALYKRAVRNRSPDWIGGDEREAFLGRDLVDLWDRVDVVQAAGNNDAIYSSDPVAATNGLTLRGYQIEVDQERATMVTANVTVHYAERAPEQVVRYILVKERGNWRIADISNGGSSLKGALQAFLRVPTAP